MHVKDILSIRRYKAGYLLKNELIDGAEFGGKDFAIVSAYTPEGDYIGDAKTAYRLCKTRGIQPEPRSRDTPEANGGRGRICSIGFCASEQKWYGWSHREIYGFSVGSMVEKGDCGYTPATVEELYEEYTQPESGGYRSCELDHVETTLYGIRIRVDTVVPTRENCTTGELFDFCPSAPEYYEIATGRGAWTALTLADARQMACDFAAGVS